LKIILAIIDYQQINKVWNVLDCWFQKLCKTMRGEMCLQAQKLNVEDLPLKIKNLSDILKTRLAGRNVN